MNALNMPNVQEVIMHSDLEHARQTLEQVTQSLHQLEHPDPQERETAQRHEATLHLARLRVSIAWGRVIALERSLLAHKACEEIPSMRLC